MDTIRDFEGNYISADGRKLSDETISNMISIVKTPELLNLFTPDEISLIKIAIKANITKKLDLIKYTVVDEEKPKTKTL